MSEHPGLEFAPQTISGPKMSGNFVRERQRIVYIYNIHVDYICKQYVAARARNFQTFLGRLCPNVAFPNFTHDALSGVIYNLYGIDRFTFIEKTLTTGLLTIVVGYV